MKNELGYRWNIDSHDGSSYDGFMSFTEGYVGLKGNGSNLSIYDNDDDLIMMLDKEGQTFWKNNLKTGLIGLGYQSSATGLTFLLDRGNFMSWAIRNSNTEETYDSVLDYSRHNGFIFHDPVYYQSTSLQFLYGSHIISLGLYYDYSPASLSILGENGVTYSVNLNTVSDGRLKKNIENSNVNALNASGGDPPKAFFMLAKERGIDPNSIVNLIK